MFDFFSLVYFIIIIIIIILLVLFIYLFIFLENCMRVEILVFPNCMNWYLYIYLFSLLTYLSFWGNCARLIPFFFKTQWSMYTTIGNLTRRISSVDDHLTMIEASRVFYRIPITIHGSILRGTISNMGEPSLDVLKSTITCPHKTLWSPHILDNSYVRGMHAFEVSEGCHVGRWR